MKIEKFGRLDGSVFYQITDSVGRVVMLSPEEALDLLAWLSRQKSELVHLLHLDNGPDTGAVSQKHKNSSTRRAGPLSATTDRK